MPNDLRRAARHIAESMALETTRQREVIQAYEAHIRELATALRTLEAASGLEAHDCAICQTAFTGGDAERQKTEARA